ncbi:phage integrase N-terminal SAM-like domain-containing protein [Patescibacteria group bacterium]|nr:phage integrase N-terminal SAM-like domain-containing protein [Patescibacteria group bacterium]MBU4458744.1 phage integrase N-terminal SAM-like domain-containing protein [Patescibacteria group bacterium]MCG2696045.1 phage integrase N-terminal SAM-like domain-containing protein [Candidatus Portnoybacteria bacterium]
MKNNNKSLIEYISDFSRYCKTDRDFSNKTIENYGRYLNRFISWLKTSNLAHLTPQELSIKHISDYQEYLSKQNIKKITQNYYLIALRMLISYFIEKEIPCSISTEKIKLLKTEKQRLKDILTPKQLEILLLAPNVSHNIGLRDRVILEIISSIGLKVTELTRINKKDVKIDDFTNRAIINIFDRKNNMRSVYLPHKTTEWLIKYLKNRKDNNEALLINYKPRKQNDQSPTRLTARSVERIVQKYGNIINFSQSITPEILRNAYM